jgi:hypothetical protein
VQPCIALSLAMIMSPLVFQNKAWFGSLFTVLHTSSNALIGVGTHLYKGFRASMILGLIKSSKILQNATPISLCINGILDLVWYHCILGMGDNGDVATGGLMSVIKNILVPRLDDINSSTAASSSTTSVSSTSSGNALVMGSPANSFAMHNGVVGLFSYSILNFLQIIPGYLAFNASK